MKKSRIIILASLIIIVGWFSTHHSSAKSKWITINTGPIASAIYGLGTVTSDKIYNLKVGVTTSVKEVFVKEGDDVQAGQPLIQFVNLPLVRAAFAGTVTSLPLHVNETAYPQTEALTLMDLKDCYILVALEQEAGIKVRKGQKVKISFSGLPDQVFEGIVNSVYPKDQEVYVKITSNQLPPTILPEMSADVSIILNEKTDALLVPLQAVQNSTVTLRRNGKTIKESIKLGAISDEYGEIISNNIKNNDEVLVKT
jgi:multidrug efflux pump subunit AcrA (membrane-fusion protein)